MHRCSRETVTDARDFYRDDGPEATMQAGGIYCICGREFQSMDDLPATADTTPTEGET